MKSEESSQNENLTASFNKKASRTKIQEQETYSYLEQLSCYTVFPLEEEYRPQKMIFLSFV